MATSAALLDVLRALLSPENAQRTQAEAAYNSLQASAGAADVASGLMEIVATQTGAQDSPVR